MARRLSKKYSVVAAQKKAGTGSAKSTGNKREAIRLCRRMTKKLGVGATGTVYAEPSGALVYQCHVEHLKGARVRLVVEEL